MDTTSFTSDETHGVGAGSFDLNPEEFVVNINDSVVFCIGNIHPGAIESCFDTSTYSYEFVGITVDGTKNTVI